MDHRRRSSSAEGCVYTSSSTSGLHGFTIPRRNSQTSFDFQQSLRRKNNLRIQAGLNMRNSPRHSPRVIPNSDLEYHHSRNSSSSSVGYLFEHQMDIDENLDEFEMYDDDDLEDNQVEHEQPEEEPESDNQESGSPNVDEIRTPTPRGPTNVSGIIDMLFDIHSALKNKQRGSDIGKRTAASALAASNLVSVVAGVDKVESPEDDLPSEKKDEIYESVRSMLDCAVCQDIYTEATEATCCGAVFCRDCIERWVSDRGSCPMCRKDLNFQSLRPNRHAQRMANEMHVPCPYCDEVHKKSEMDKHMENCSKAPVAPPPPTEVRLRRSLLVRGLVSLERMRYFLTMPSPVEAEMMQCYIRTRGSGVYELYTLENDILIASAVRRRQLDMSVSFQIQIEMNNNEEYRSQNRNIGRLERNFVGSQYTAHLLEGSESFEIGAVQYAATFGKTPRQMRVAIPGVQQIENGTINSNDHVEGNVALFESNICRDGQTRGSNMLNHIDNPDATSAINLINKPPVWIESLEAYCLDFGGRVAAASVKNFLLGHPEDMDKTLMLFGRTSDRQVYSMDYRHPLSPLQAFQIALSSMDSHLVTFD